MEIINVEHKSFLKSNLKLSSDKPDTSTLKIKKIARHPLLGFFLSLINLSTKVIYTDKKNTEKTIYFNVNSLISHILEASNKSSDKNSVKQFKEKLKDKKITLKNIDADKLRSIFNESLDLPSPQSTVNKPASPQTKDNLSVESPFDKPASPIIGCPVHDGTTIIVYARQADGNQTPYEIDVSTTPKTLANRIAKDKGCEPEDVEIKSLNKTLNKDHESQNKSLITQLGVVDESVFSVVVPPLQTRAKIAAKGKIDNAHLLARDFSKMKNLLLQAEIKEIPLILEEAAKKPKCMQFVIDNVMMDLPVENPSFKAMKAWLLEKSGQKALSEVLDRLNKISSDESNIKQEHKTNFCDTTIPFLMRLEHYHEKLSLSEATRARVKDLIKSFQDLDEKTKKLPEFMWQ